MGMMAVVGLDDVAVLHARGQQLPLRRARSPSPGAPTSGARPYHRRYPLRPELTAPDQLIIPFESRPRSPEENAVI